MRKFLILALSCLLTVPVMASTSSESVESVTTSENTYTIRGQITWTDSDNQDGLRPYAVMMHLMDGDTEVDTAKATVVNEFKYKFEDLPDTHYTVEIDDIEGYEVASSSHTENSTKYIDYTAIHTKTNLEVEGAIIWDDEDDRDGIRPDEVEVRLMDGDTVIEKTVVSSPEWKCHFDKLNKFDASREINYTLDADAIDGYKISSGKLSLKYAHKPAKTDIEGQLVFDDNNNQDGTRPDTVTINLMEGDTIFSSIDVSTIKSSFVFTDIPKNRDGKEVSYSFQGAEEDGYTVSTTGDTVTYTHDSDIVSVSGTVTWKDNDDEKEKRPASVNIMLYGNGKFIKAQKTANGVFEFTNLPKYQNGREIEYTVDEESFPNYKKTVAGTNIVNTYSAVEHIQNDPSLLLPPEKEEVVEKKPFPIAPLIVTILAACGVGAYLWKKFRQDDDSEE